MSDSTNTSRSDIPSGLVVLPEDPDERSDYISTRRDKRNKVSNNAID